MRARSRRIFDGQQCPSALNRSKPRPMKRFVVCLLLVALPIRTVLAVSVFGCSMLPMHESHAEGHGAPCPAHAAEGAAETQAAADDASVSCPSCALACCAALAPQPTRVATAVHMGSFVAAVFNPSFANAIPHALERPPRLA